MALEKEAVICTLEAPEAYTRPWYLRMDKKGTTTSIGHKMATYASREDAETASEPRETHSMNLTAAEQKVVSDAICTLLYQFQKAREGWSDAKDV